MKKPLYALSLILILLTSSCASVSKFNNDINTPRAAKDLKNDVDFAYKKLKSLHPYLYLYTSQAELEHRLDSLKSTIQEPMTSNDFYFQLAPVLTTIGQGHTMLFPLTKKMTAKERKIELKKKTLPLSQFDYELMDSKLYIVRNFSADSTILAGTEVMKIDSIAPQAILEKYEPAVPYDGYNKKFQKSIIGKRFPTFYHYQHEKRDSVQFLLAYNDSVFEKTIRRNEVKMSASDSLLKKAKPDKALDKKREIQGYDKRTKLYAKDLAFLTPDSSVALLTIRNFTNGDYRKFYKQTFETLQTAHTRHLIIDLRDNTGGRLDDNQLLFRYLTDSAHIFTDKPEMNSPFTPINARLYAIKNASVLQKIMLPLFVPGMILSTGISLAQTQKNKLGYYLLPGYGKALKPKKDNFKGDIYLITNSLSFSATSQFAANLKNMQRAYVVGDETGGADNGCVAGYMPIITLPKSKLPLKIGTLNIIPHYRSGKIGRGVMPDTLIIPTYQDRQTHSDPEITWILENIQEK